jgi:hypothetical protein
VSRRVFISYHRDSGHELANLVNSELQRRGHRTYLDVFEARGGPFWPEIQRQIANCRAFVLVCSEDQFGREREGEDWVAKEVEEALGHSRHIVPFFSRTFVRPSQLATPFARALEYGGVSMDAQFPAATFDRLSELVGSPVSRRLTLPIAVVGTVFAVSGVLIVVSGTSPWKHAAGLGEGDSGTDTDSGRTPAVQPWSMNTSSADAASDAAVTKRRELAEADHGSGSKKNPPVTGTTSWWPVPPK